MARERKNRPTMWAIRLGEFVELYDIPPFEPDAVRLADFTREDFARFFELDLATEGTPYLIRCIAQFAERR